MKNSTLTFAIILCVSLAFAQGKKDKVRLGYLTGNFANPSYVNGKLKEMTQITYKASLVDGKVVKGEKLKYKNSNVSNIHSRHIFNEAGQPMFKTFFNDNGDPLVNIVFNYEAGLLNKVFYIRNDTLTRINSIINEKGLIKQIEYMNPSNNEIWGKAIYKYNNTDFFSSSVYYNKSGEKRNEIIYKRDKFGRIISITNKNAKGKVMGLSMHTYGEHFEPISIDAEIAQGKKINRIGKREVEFDENGNWIKVVRYRDGEPRNMTFSTYKFYDD